MTCCFPVSFAAIIFSSHANLPCAIFASKKRQRKCPKRHFFFFLQPLDIPVIRPVKKSTVKLYRSGLR